MEKFNFNIKTFENTLDRITNNTALYDEIQKEFEKNFAFSYKFFAEFNGRLEDACNAGDYPPATKGFMLGLEAGIAYVKQFVNEVKNEKPFVDFVKDKSADLDTEEKTR